MKTEQKEREEEETRSMPSNSCPKTGEVCCFYHDGQCYETGEGKDLSRIERCE